MQFSELPGSLFQAQACQEATLASGAAARRVQGRGDARLPVAVRSRSELPRGRLSAGHRCTRQKTAFC